MTKDEAMKMALEALEFAASQIYNENDDDIIADAIIALRAALEQPSDIEAAVRAENEACAKVCDEMDHDGVMVAADCAATIRARMK